ncbi:PAS domain S-box protein [uncultured Methanoregula sp.]|uniref:PAS domain S-box protein n=1 Tax=uncultured Methanoregula sp. TaxID=1005933 RepID=UPI002AAB98B6|nr:PAS domain S-box protein [uncultured Methanoregula sp.]
MISILYVDDEPGLLEIAQLFLEKAGDFSVDTSTSATESLDALKSRFYDAIISDYQMPGMDGIAFLKVVRERFGDIPFILFTGRGREEIVIEAINNGADFYLQKGGDPRSQFAELAHKIRQAVARRQTEGKLRTAYEELTSADEELRGQYEELVDNEQRIRESEEKFRVLSENAPVAIIVYQDEKIVYANAHTIRITGYSREELYAKRFWEILDPDYQEIGRQRGLARIRGEEVPSQYEIRYLTKAGEMRWVYLSAGIIHFGGKPAAIILLLGITDRKRAEEELQAANEQLAAANQELRKQYDALNETRNRIGQSERDYRSIITNMQDGFYRTDMEGNLLMVSPSFLKLFGFTGNEELIGKNIRDTFYPNPVDWDEFLRQMEKTGSVLRYHLTVRRRDNSPLVVSATSHYVLDETGRRAGIEGILHDSTDVVNAELALRESEEKFRGMAERSAEAIIILDEEMHVSYASPSCLMIFGYDPEELEGKNQEFAASTIFSGHSLEFLSEVRALKGGNPIADAGMLITRKDGAPAHISMHVIPVMHDGIFAGAQVTIRDITEQKRAEEALRESEAKFASVFRNSPVTLTLISGKDGTFADVNDAFVRNAGYSRDDVIGKTPDSVGLFVQNEAFESIRPVLRSGKPVNGIEVQFRAKNGAVNTCLYSGTIITIGENPYILSNVEDITRRKVMESELQENQRLLAKAMDLAQLVSWEYDTRKRLFTFDERFYRLYGTTAEREGGYQMTPETYIREFVHPDDRDSVVVEVQKAQHTADPAYESHMEHRIIRRDGAIRNLLVRIRPVMDTTGEVIRFHGANQDITDHKKTEEALLRANRQVNLLTGVTRHDILNKVAVILGFIRIAGMKSPDPELAGYLGRMEGATMAIRSQIEFTRVYEDIGSHEPQWIDLDAILPRSQVPAAISLETRVQGISLLADPMLENVFFNLLDNTIRHGQRVTTITVSSSQRGTDLVITWEDDGIGVPADEKDHIFERGFGKNTGFGLFLVREILSLTHMMITENGEPGKGARFEITVPDGGYRISVP